MEKLIRRNKYLPAILEYLEKPLIKVITGQRRVGKSYFLKQIIAHITENIPLANIIYIDKENFDFDTLRSAADLVKYAENNQAESKNFLFIDEVQEIQEFERAVRHLLSKGFDIYLTGSNSILLSGELASMLTGRYIQFPIYPLDFAEFCEFHSLKKDTESLKLFIRYGGMPFLYHINLNDDNVFSYLKNIFQSILYKDVVGRFGIKNTELLERLMLYVADNLGSIVSAKKISDFLKSQSISASNTSVLNYLQMVGNSFLINKVPRFDLQGKKLLEVGEKYYFTDTGIRNALLGFKPNDINKILENIVYSHLVSNGYSVNIGKLADFEIDFVARKNNQIFYFQVTYLLANEKVIEREFGNLKLVHDNYPKYVISMDEFNFEPEDGIKHLSLFNFLNSRNY